MHDYMSPILKGTPRRQDVVDSSANSRTEPAAAGQLASVSGLADVQKINHPSGLDSDGSSGVFVTASPIDLEMQPTTAAVPTPGVQGTGVDNNHAGVDNIRNRSMALPESDADLSDFQDFNAALLTMQKSAARIRSDDDDVFYVTLAATM
jgi:hypothetical protein